MWQWITWQRASIDQILIRRPRAEARILLAYCVFYVALSAATAIWIAGHPAPLLGATSFTQDLSYLFGFKLAALFLVPLAVFYAAGYGIQSLQAGWRPTRAGMVRIGLAIAIGLAINSWHFSGIGRAAAEKGLVASAPLFALAFALPLLTAALPEEFVFRGLLQTRLERVGGRLVALVTTAILFAAWHVPSRYLLASGVEGQAGDLGSVLVGTGLPVLIVGLIFGLLWDRYRNLPMIVCLHWAIDVPPAASSLFGISF